MMFPEIANKIIAMTMAPAAVAASMQQRAAATENAHVRTEVEAITIGEQRWMKRNMATTKFRNGDPISRQDKGTAWADAARTATPAYTSYDNQMPPPPYWGLLYNFAAVTDRRGICPAGWRVPNNQDWRQLEAYLGGGTGAAKALKAVEGWGPAQAGSDATGFGALPAGWRTQDGIFYLAGRIAYFWTSDLSPDRTVVSHMLFDDPRPMFRIGYNPGMGQSLRCIAE